MTVDIDTALLRTFVILARTRHFGRTGEQIGRTQSAVSAQIKKLEETLGCDLVSRTTRTVSLTRDGDALLGEAQRIVEMADAMLARFQDRDIAGEVRFGSPEDFASAYLPAILAAFAATHDRVILHVECDFTLPLIARLEKGELDLIIIKQHPGQTWQNAVPLLREQLVWAGPPARGRSGGSGRHDLAALTAGERPLPLVLSPAPCVYRQRALEALKAAGISWTNVFTSPSQGGLVAAIEAGLGFAPMPASMVPPQLWRSRPGDGWPDLADAELCLLAGPRANPAAEALARHIETQVALGRGVRA